MKLSNGLFFICLFSFSVFAQDAEKCAKQALNAKAFYKLRDVYMSKLFGGEQYSGSLANNCYNKLLAQHKDMQVAIKCLDDDSSLKQEICTSTQET